MAKEIIKSGVNKYTQTCSECAAIFTYQREDVHTNFVRGGEWVGCPECGHSHRHLGASNIWDHSVWRMGRYGEKKCQQ